MNRKQRKCQHLKILQTLTNVLQLPSDSGKCYPSFINSAPERLSGLTQRVCQVTASPDTAFSSPDCYSGTLRELFLLYAPVTQSKGCKQSNPTYWYGKSFSCSVKCSVPQHWFWVSTDFLAMFSLSRTNHQSADVLFLGNTALAIPLYFQVRTEL